MKTRMWWIGSLARVALITFVLISTGKFASGQVAGPPVILSASGAYGDLTLTIVFNEPVNDVIATDPFNYFISGSDGSALALLPGTLAADQQTLTLPVDPSTPFVEGLSYSLEACCVCDVDFDCMTAQSIPISLRPGPGPLIASGSVWRYLDTGVDPGTAWRDPFFDDSSWKSGPAELGFGDGDEATVITRSNIFGPLITAYFRHAFNVPDTSAIPGLTLQLWRDDGAIVYLNGVEVYRNNMPAGPASYSTLASSVAGDDGNVAVTVQLSSSQLVSGANLIAVEVHQNVPSSSDLSFDLSLAAGNPPPANNPPVANSQSVTVPGNTPTPITLTGSDADGDPLSYAVTSFPAHGTLGGTAPNLTYTPQSGYAGPDSFNFKVNDGKADSAPASVSITVQAVSDALVPAGALWKYLDTGVDPGGFWMQDFFNDASWRSGAAELGFGDNDEATVIRSTNATGRLITAYFRHRFFLNDRSGISGLSLQLWRDDGAIVYLNGVEVFRNNMPSGPVSYSTLAISAAPDDGNVALTTQLSSSLLVNGTNLVAVEVHQNASSSSDLSFDLQLSATEPPPNRAPIANNQSVSTTQNTPVAITLTGSDPDGDALTFTVTSGPSHGSLSGTPPNVTYTPATDYIGPDGFSFKVNDGQLDSSNAVVSIQVTPPPVPPDLLSASACGSVVTATFNEALDPVTASDVFNYLISGSDGSFASLLSAVVESDQQTVTLTVDASTPLIAGVSYTLSASTICDTGGACLSEDSVPLQVDTTAPTVTCSIAVNTLFPPNGRFIDVGLSATANDGVLGVQIFSDEPEAVEACDVIFEDGVLKLRAQRDEEGDGRVYLIVVTATDACGNIGVCCRTVVVPHDSSQTAINSVNAQAAVAHAHCSPQGAPSTPHQLVPGPGTFDLSGDFSPSNPSGAWTYGYQATLGGAFVPFSVFKYNFDEAGVPVEVWAISHFTVPAAMHNATTNTVTSDGGQGVFPPGTVWFYPGPSDIDDGGADPNDNYGVIRFTVQAGGAGIYDLESAVRSAYTGPISGDTDFHVLHNGIELLGQFLPEEGSTSFEAELSLAVGDTIDFVIGRGLDNSFHGSGLIIDATLTRVQ